MSLEEKRRGGDTQGRSCGDRGSNGSNAHTSQETEIANNHWKLEESHGAGLPSASRRNEPS